MSSSESGKMPPGETNSLSFVSNRTKNEVRNMATENIQAAQSKQSEKKKDDPQIEVKEASPKVEAETETKAAEPVSRVGRAEAIIRRNVLWSLGAGVVPMPLVDMLAVTGVQVKMLAELSSLYGVPFREELATKLVGSLLSGVLGVGAGALLGGSLAKFIPVVGTAFGVISIPIVAGAFTHSTGKVFLMHFEAGGTLLDFDPHAMRTYFKQEFEKAKEQIRQEEQGKAGKPS